MAEDQDREEGQERPSRPSTAAARRERRGAARPAARKDADGKPEARAKARPEKSAKADSTAADRKGRPTPARDRKDDKGSIFGRISRFLREVVAELRKVIWPTRKQLIGYTAVVLVFVAFMVALVAGLDVGLGKGVFWLFG
ncbi:preprotein translocase subunit SecE [Actinokineospora globicatena]|uniref:Protein translocase subunit SecE n=1 Tax=Actinokineospora globicatena TaxID=103729 RepID=A0A9W6QVE0_9PSEU|nr:preprotein translocase subunit SecE [Actinokineospora globicatena]MCP2301792.1 preprotein translocase subunit SecE [Actinokineospora globicatena]GLW76550.1 protein translocase subunit SecE [Actinokineospora globicatena]GLW83384.1 protein translocase subunit SecE [Actinokineospora globicatena]GLW95590.1 protein translocase subunit SecE [Actinokineospora globicatena]